MTQANALLHKHTEVSAQLLEVLQLIEVTLSLEHLLIATLPNASSSTTQWFPQLLWD